MANDSNSDFIQQSFLGGEFSPFAQGRTDLPAYKSALNVCRNGFPIEEGAWLRRSGTRFAATTRNGAPGRLIEFDFSKSSPYLIEFTDGRQRLFSPSAQITGLTNPLPLDFRLATANDNQQVVTVSTANPAVVQTTTAHGWATGDQGGFLFGNVTAANQTPLLCNRQFVFTVVDATHVSLSDPITGAAIDGNTLGWNAASAPAGSVVIYRTLTFVFPYTNGDWSTLRAVQAEATQIWLHPNYQPQSLTASVFPTASNFATFGGGTIAFTDGPYLDPPTDGSTLTPTGLSGPIQFAASSITAINGGQGFQPSDVGRLIRVLSEPALWNVATAYVAGNSVKFNGVYFTCLAANTGQIPDVAIAFWGINTAAATWSWATITQFNSVLNVSATINGAALVNTNAIVTWRMGVYTAGTYPACGVYYEGRIWLAGAIANRIDGSVANGIIPTNPSASSIDMTPTAADGTVGDANGISYIFNSDDVNQILWMKATDSGILCGSRSKEWLVKASQLSDPITPTSIQAHPVSNYGSANVEPAFTELTTCFVHRYGRKVLEAFPDVFSGRYSAPNLSRLWKHLTQSGILEIKYQEELLPSLWMRCGNGSWIGATYKRNTLMSSQGPEFVGGHRHDLGSGRLVESIEVGPSVDGTLDTLAMVTNDPTTNIRHIEILRDLFDVNAPITSGWFVDDGIVPSGGFISGQNLTLNGLWHLNGKTVTATVGGCDCGDALVTNGSMTVPIDINLGDVFTSAYLASISSPTAYGAQGCGITSGASTFTVPAVVGFTYTSQGQLLRPDAPDSLAAPGTAGFAKTGHIYQFGMFFQGAQGVSVGTDFTALNACQFKSPGGRNPLTLLQLYSGIYWNTIKDSYDFDSMIAWQIVRPYPCAITEIAGFMDTIQR